MGYVFRKNKEGWTECFLCCDHCGFEVTSIPIDSASIGVVVEYLIENKWFRLKPSKDTEYRELSFCPKCAVALGYIKDKGELKDECQKNGIIEGIETMLTGN